MENWVDEMIKREATPKTLRTDTVEQFCEIAGISESTYYYQSSKKENQKEILRMSLNLAKRGTPDVLEKLREKAEAGDTKAMEMFLNYVLELSKNLDIKSDGEALKQVLVQYIDEREATHNPDSERISTTF